MSIDIERLKVDREYWDSVAPEGATHYIIDNGRDVAARLNSAFHRDEGEKWQECGSSSFWEKDTDNPLIIIPCPSPAWDGEGLPPVGVECEFSYGDSDVWAVCKPMHYGNQAVFLKSHREDESGMKEYSVPLRMVIFRPIPTEKELVVEAMMKKWIGSNINVLEWRAREEFLGSAYDAGLLKMPEGEQ